MGNSFDQTPSKVKNAYNPSLNGWEITQKGDLYNVWKNRITHQQMQQYGYTASDALDYKKIKDLFAFRYQREFLVASKYFKQISTSQICSTYYGASIFTQRITGRLNTLNPIKFPSVLHVYHASLRGFNELYQRIGYFPVNQQMIGINGQRKIKVWVNSNFGAYNSQFGSRYKTEKDLIKQIIEIIDNYTDHDNQPLQQLSVFLDKDLNFKNTLNLLYDYAEKYNVEIPAQIDSNNDLKHQNYLHMISGMSQNIDTKAPEKFSIALSKSNHHSNRSNNEGENIINQQIKQEPADKNINHTDNKVKALPIKFQNNTNIQSKHTINKINQNNINLQSKHNNIKMNDPMTITLDNRNQDNKPTFIKQKDSYPTQRTFVNKLMNANNIKEQQRKHSPIPDNIIYKPQNEIIKKQITNIKSLNYYNNNQFKPTINTIEIPKRYERAPSPLPQKIHRKQYQSINNIIPIRMEAAKNTQIKSNSMPRQEQKNNHNKNYISNRVNMMYYQQQQEPIKKNEVIQSKLPHNKSKIHLEIPLSRERNVHTPVLINSVQSEKFIPNTMNQQKIVYPQQMLRNQNQQIKVNYVNTIKNNQDYIIQTQKVLQNKIQNKSNFQIQNSPHAFIKKVPNPTFEIQQNLPWKNERIIINAPRNQQIAPRIAPQSINYQQNIKINGQQLERNNEQTIKKSIVEQKRKNGKAKQAKLTKKHEYVYEFDLPLNQGQDEQDQTQHIKIIINSEVKNKNKNVKVKKMN